MEEIKEKAIELLLDITSKESFEVMLYKKVETEDLTNNKLLFNLVNINYRKDCYKNLLLNILQEFVSDEAIVISKVNLYSRKIKDEKDNNVIYKNFNKIYNLFDFDLEYDLMWGFYNFNERIGLIEINYEKEENVIKDLKQLCNRVCCEYYKLSTIEEKINFLVDGFNDKSIDYGLEIELLQKKKVFNRKWYHFW